VLVVGTIMNGALKRLSQPLAQRLLRPNRVQMQYRGFAADAHGEVKLNCWDAPTNIAAWKEEHIVLFVLGCWAVAITGSLKHFGGKKGDANENPGTPAPAAGPAH
jgi:hypothetical protein